MKFEYLISLKQRLPLTITKEQLNTLVDMNVEFVIDGIIPIDEQIEMIIEDKEVFSFIETVLAPTSQLNRLRLISKYLIAKKYRLPNPTDSKETYLKLIKNIVDGVFKLKLKE